MIFIYLLIDPRFDTVRYVGKSNLPKRRYNQHVSGAKRSKIHKNHTSAWIHSLISNGLKPELFIIDEVNEVEWEFWEKHYISLYRSWGFDLTNHENGGKSGSTLVSLKTRQRISLALRGNCNKRGKKLSNEQKINCGNGRRGKSNSYEWIDKVGKKVLQFDLEENLMREWNSCNEAAKHLGLSQGNISAVCKGTRKTEGKFKWKFKN